MEQNQRHYSVLELPKILERLASRTACSAAARQAREILPADTLPQALRLQEETWEAYDRIAKFSAPSFGGLTDIEPSVRRAQAGGVLSMGELLSVAGVLRVVRHLDEWAKNAEYAKMQALLPYFETLSPNKYLEELITTAILSEDTMSDRASADLAAIRRKMRTCGERARSHLGKIIRSPSYQKLLQDSIITMRDNRFVVPVKAEHKNEVPGLVHDTSASGATLFVEPMAVVEYNNELKMLAAKEQEEIHRILADLSAQTGDFGDSICRSAQAAADLNVIFAKAQLGYEMRASMPILGENGVIRLNKARHPLLDPATVVPVDVELGARYTTLVITGPNTGGKTVTLKTIGLLTLMALCGLMIPAADESRISVFTHVLADIGDEQSIEQSLSTFSAHMTNLVSILEIAGKGSLVLMDELGAGTDPVEGAALAIALLEEFRRRGAVVAATTHYAELKAYALDTPGVENAGCEFDVETLRPTYRLLTGIPGRSNAFAISARLGLPREVLDRAETFVSHENRRFESVVRSLEDTRASLESERERVLELQRELDAQRNRSRDELARMERQRTEILEQARQQAAGLTDRASRQAADLLEEIEKYKRSLNTENAAEMTRRARAAFKSGMKKLADAADPVDSINLAQEAAHTPQRSLAVGDRVLIVDLNQQGQVLGEPDDGGQVLVQMGIIKTRVPLANLRLLENPKSSRSGQSAPRAGGVQSRAFREVVTELDLRGKAADEALYELDAFLDRCVMSGLKTVRIIHGKGTGVLRAAVQKHLRGHVHVAAARLGGYGEGGDGVTVAELK